MKKICKVFYNTIKKDLDSPKFFTNNYDKVCNFSHNFVFSTTSYGVSLNFMQTQYTSTATTRYHYIPLLKQYELSNHLGNVLVTLSAKPRLFYEEESNIFSHKEADIISVSDYYPFGMMMPERHWSSGEYRFGFNSMERDDELKGSGNSYDFGARIYDSRVGRFLSIDPLFSAFPSESNYVFAGNSPILYIDVDGQFKLEYSEEQLREWGVTEQQLQSFVNILNIIFSH